MAGEIELCEYSAAWPRQFIDVAMPIRAALGSVAQRIDHIGSTAIPQIAAKPVIDVQISVASLIPENAFREPLEAAGYVWRQDNPDLTKRYFRESPGERRTHIHVRQAGSLPEQLALLFRDYLRVSDVDRSLYEETKRELAVTCRDDRLAYTEGKGPAIWEILHRASRWSQLRGWHPQVSDA
ncbi:MAG: GrpB family protein [Gemmatimonadetes bacterium]|jgi:GrpB-like predicted nucleotidyltransferase (UPF0157 family)|nr:GrpB family protein [Gemmatimonadota bacterium]MBT4611059.1 GrpB family protein [Gemmatimonadota bacterium]MBT5057772.1 GrpB family protein [Gemmatimonadota bacterium]MBT5141316.1 GrpB family protein [Gemmatimonadota bacterium]MBT5590397.1 GrpB family protein [Gemmatimonadota bacterium]